MSEMAEDRIRGYSELFEAMTESAALGLLVSVATNKHASHENRVLAATAYLKHTVTDRRDTQNLVVDPDDNDAAAWLSAVESGMRSAAIVPSTESRIVQAKIIRDELEIYLRTAPRKRDPAMFAAIMEAMSRI